MKPTDKQVIEWARKAQVANAWDINWFDPYYASFAILAYEAGAAAEREACAKRLDAIGCDHCAENIRLRGRE